MSAGERWTPRTAAAHAFVADLESPELGDAERHHLLRVRRLRDGDVITVGDGRGRWRPVRLAGVLEPCGVIVADPPPHPAVTVAFAPPKGDRPAWVVQKLTEIGVDRIVPLICDRGVVRWDGERAARHVERLRRIAVEAAAQSRRTWLPDVAPPVDFADAVRWEGTAIADTDDELAGGDVHAARPSPERPIVLIGPEGGWSPEERATAAALGVPRVGLGPHVLRTDTAAVVAGALLVALRPSRPAG